MNKRIFIIHGHDKAAYLELEKFLISLGLIPVILFNQDDRGMTLIEKFEHYAPQCSFAFVLLTPDDKQAELLTGQDKWRSRQNVILEMGWFMANLGRKRVAMLHKGSVELPSDLMGVLYLSFNTSIFEVSEKIKQRLAGCGFI